MNPWETPEFREGWEFSTTYPIEKVTFETVEDNSATAVIATAEGFSKAAMYGGEQEARRCALRLGFSVGKALGAVRDYKATYQDDGTWLYEEVSVK